jgi:hypothetical protein
LDWQSNVVRWIAALVVMLWSLPAFAQDPPTLPPTPTTKPAQPRAPREPIGIRGFVTFGNFRARAADTFDAVLGSNMGLIFGGGAHVLLPGGFYIEASASRFRRDGERVFIAGDQEIFPLGIPLQVTLTPLEITGGWRYRHCPRPVKGRVAACRPSVIPYVGGGFSSYRYEETSDFSMAEDDVDERFSGFHVLGGVEYRATPLLSVGGELAWSTIADAIGEGGVAAVFNETDLGGITIRLKVSIGR